MKLRKFLLFITALALIPGAAWAQEIPLKNWTAPLTWSAPREGRITTNAYSVAFMPMPPCRVYDSRSFSILPAATSRTIDVDGGPCAGIPAAASAYSVNITAFGAPASSSYAFITAYATGSARPVVSTLNFLPGTQTANAAIVPAGNDGDIEIYSSAETHFIVDINGYYATDQNAADGFVSSSIDNIGVVGTSTNSYGVAGSSQHSYGVVGLSGGTSAVAGVAGVSNSAVGVYGTSTNAPGILAESTYLDGISATGGRHGLVAYSTGTTGALWGVFGVSSSSSANAAGIYGVDNSGPVGYTNTFIPAGVRGESDSSIGVLGVSEYIGTVGSRSNSDGSGYVWGALGYSAYGVYASGNFAATGTKSFVEPHATDPEKVVKYVALEGPEAGTYFRGRGFIAGGQAVITVPEDFRMVTDTEGLTVHITPMGGMAQVGVVSADLDRIVVEGSRDMEFSYIVYGVRKSYRDFRPIQQQAGEFMPLGPDARIPDSLSQEAKRRLISTGVYNQDGTVNMETAERLGWTRVWQRESKHVND